MMKHLFLCLTPLLFVACGTSPTGFPDQTAAAMSIGASSDDSKSSVTVTRTIKAPDKDTAGAPIPGTGGVKYAVGDGGAVNFEFTSRPGSRAAYITSYRVVRDNINGKDFTVADSPSVKVNIFVPAGYTCPAASSAQSCDFLSVDAKPANGVPSAPYGLYFAGGLAGIAIATNASVQEEFDIEFYGQSATGDPVIIKQTKVIATAKFTEG